MRNIKLVLEYDGTDFVGWQSQVNGRSVQDEITRVLSQILQEEIKVTGAGRTDSGVHARGQVANFRTSATMKIPQLQQALDGLLPRDISVKSTNDVDNKFHARFDATSRRYFYSISRRPSALRRRFTWVVPFGLDPGLMKTAAERILGEKDFQSFCKVAAQASHYRCFVTISRWGIEEDTMTYEVKANRFLHGMVRALVGTMVDIGRGFTTLEQFDAIIAGRDRSLAGTAAPPQGLFLEEVTYGETTNTHPITESDDPIAD